MCGIYGMSFFPNVNLKPGVIRAILRKLATESQSRGRDATGLSFATKSGIKTFKHNVDATRFLKLENTNRVIRDGLSFKPEDRTYSVIGHTRAQTQGCHTNPDNNHPIKTGSIVGVHNGWISNDSETFRWLEGRTNDKVKRIAEVDSEAIFALINYNAKIHKFPQKMVDKALVGHTATPVTKSIQESFGKLFGSMACALQDADNPKSLWLFKRSNPLAVNYFRDEGIMIFASEQRFINSATSGYLLAEPEYITVPVNSGICINVEDNEYSSYEMDVPENVGYSALNGGW